jgi:hypothetical protein
VWGCIALIYSLSDQPIKYTTKKCRIIKNFWAIFCIFARIVPTRKSAAPPSVLLHFSEPPDPSAYNYILLDQTINRQEKKTKIKKK